MGNYNLDTFLSTVIAMLTGVGGKLIFALLVMLIGNALVKKIAGLCEKAPVFNKADAAVKTFTLSFIRVALYVLLVITAIGILGVPMASVVAVLASASVTVGLALQGALSNLAGGIMLLVFKPFTVGDYVDAAGISGVAKEITLFYTVFNTLDNKRVTVPNGALMNANIVNYSSEDLRRVDLTFACAKSEQPAKIQDIIQGVIAKNEKSLKDPAPFARLSGGTNEAMEFTVRIWCKNADYWDIYFDVTQGVAEAFAANGIQAPAVRVIADK